MNEEILLQQTKSLLASLDADGIPHVLVGGLALLQYVDGRNTRGIDLLKLFALPSLYRQGSIARADLSFPNSVRTSAGRIQRPSRRLV